MHDASQSSEFWDEGGLELCFVAQYPNPRYSFGVDEDIPNVHATSSCNLDHDIPSNSKLTLNSPAYIFKSALVEFVNI